MPRPAIELVCFDLGGVLLRCVSGWAHACQIAGVPMLDAIADPANRDPFLRASHAMEVGRITPDQFIDRITELSPYTRDQVQAVLSAWIIGVYDGVDALLDRLLAANVRIALLSNTNALHWSFIEHEDRYKIVDRIPHRFASHLIGARKPDGPAYQHVETALGVDPESILFFDDLEENITGAVWQHWHTQRIDPAGDTASQIEKYLKRYGVMD